MKHHQASMFVNVATFNDATQAEALKEYLCREGLEAQISDETKLQRFWFGATPKAGVHVQVMKQHFALAEGLLKQPATAAYTQDAIKCPSCRSLRVQYPDLTRKNILPTLFAQLGVLLHITKHKFYCEDCHYTWLKASLQDAEQKRSPMKPSVSTEH